MFDGDRRESKRLWTGYIRPRNLVKKGTPLLDEQIAVGQAGNYFTSLKLRVYGATVQYPTPSITLIMANGAGSTFSRISIDELDSIMAQLQNWKTKLLQLKPTLDLQVQQVAQAIQAQQVIQDIVANQRDMPDFQDGELDDIPPGLVDAVKQKLETERR